MYGLHGLAHLLGSKGCRFGQHSVLGRISCISRSLVPFQLQRLDFWHQNKQQLGSLATPSSQLRELLDSAPGRASNLSSASLIRNPLERTTTQELGLTLTKVMNSKKRVREEAAADSPKRTKRVLRETAVNYNEESDQEDVSVATLKKSKSSSKGQSNTIAIQGSSSVKAEVKTEGVLQKQEICATNSKVISAVVKSDVKEKVGKVAKEAPKTARKSKSSKNSEALPLAERTAKSNILVGAHVSSAGGVHNAVTNSVQIGANAFALFLRNQRKWDNPALDPKHVQIWHGNCSEHSIEPHSHVVPHGSYLVNLAQTDKERAKQAYTTFLDDLNRCKQLGIKLYNFHPGNCSAAGDRAVGIAQIAKQLNSAHSDPSSGDVITLLETMAVTGGNTIGTTFEDLRDIIALVDDKSRVAVCLDTCHVFAAGYDIRTPETLSATLDEFDKIIGIKYLRAFHVNDSKAPLDSARDLHAQIGTGFLGLRAFHALVNEPRAWGIPMVLETPIDVKNPDTGKDEQDKSIWAREIKLLESLVGADADTEEFKTMEKELQERGKAERDRIMDQVTRKQEKKGKGKAKK